MINGRQNRRLWRWRTQASEAMSGRPVWTGRSPWECRAAQSRQVRPEEAQELSSGTAKSDALAMLRCGGSCSIRWPSGRKLNGEKRRRKRR